MEFEYTSELPASRSRNPSPTLKKRKQVSGSAPSSPTKSFAVLVDQASNKRPIASHKRARLSSSHPLSRSFSKASSSSPVSSSLTLPTKSLPAFGRSPLYAALQPSPPLFSSFGEHEATSKTCVSCRRTATSTLQLAKFRKCELCSKSSCPICVRTCGGSQIGEEDDRAGTECGRTVCRECSVESSQGVPTCHQCSFSASQSSSGTHDGNHGSGISMADYDFSR